MGLTESDEHGTGCTYPVGRSGRSAKDEALELLDELSRWQLQEKQWRQILESLHGMGAALARDDADRLIDAVSELELFGPLRTSPLGETPVRPAPRRVRLLRNRLVHWIADGVPARADAPVDPVRTDYPTIVGIPGATQELVVHLFMSLDGPRAESAYHRVTSLWARCRQELAATEMIARLGLPADLPGAIEDLRGDGALAAQQTADASVQLIARREHDVLNVSVAFRADNGTWAGWDRRWNELAGADSDHFIGVIRVYAGLVPDTATAARSLGELPPVPDDDWRRDGATVAGHTVWELPPYEDDRAERRLVFVTAAERRPDLSALIWSRGDPAMTPFTGYLLHTAKVRYVLRVLGRASEPQADLGTLARLRTMRLAVDVARSNMAALLDQARLDADAGPLRDDREVADWLERQVRCNISQLEQELDHRRAAPNAPHLPLPTIGLVTALPEEFVAMREFVDGGASRWVQGDPADYVVGTMPSADPAQPHRVVLTLLADTGNGNAATSATNLVRSFPSVSQILMVGIAAGVPRPDRPAEHVRLGDIVVATWGIVDYDHVVDRPEGTVRRQEFPRPSALLTARARRLMAEELSGRRPWEDHLTAIISGNPAFRRPAADTDVLYADERVEVGFLDHPDMAESGHRPGQPKVHHGNIGSADRSMRNADARDRLADEHRLRAIEMEGKGVGDATFHGGRQWFMVRGISDYGDLRHNAWWRPYASAVAAAYVRALLAWCPPIDPHGGHPAGVGAPG